MKYYINKRINDFTKIVLQYSKCGEYCTGWSRYEYMYTRLGSYNGTPVILCQKRGVLGKGGIGVSENINKQVPLSRSIICGCKSLSSETPSPPLPRTPLSSLYYKTFLFQGFRFRCCALGESTELFTKCNFIIRFFLIRLKVSWNIKCTNHQVFKKRIQNAAMYKK